MLPLIAGLAVFLGTHSLRLAAPAWRQRTIASIGHGPWKLVYSVISLAGLALLVWGYGAARSSSVALWSAPAGSRHLTALFTVVGFVCIAAAYVPGTRIKSVLGHPMTAGIALWSLGHLIGNGRVDATILFGAFLAWSIVLFIVNRRRDREDGVVYPPGSLARDAVATLAGIAVAIVFALWLHGPLIGVRPFG